jgi:integrase
MSENYNHEIGYEALLKDFERYRKQSPKGVNLTRDRSSILLQFKVGSKSRSKYSCNCSFTLDGMVSALSKAHKVAEALKSFTSESEFWEWYDREVKDIGKIENDLLTFRGAIAAVEKDFWSRPDRRRRKRVKGHPSDEHSWNRTYGDYYKFLPLDKTVTIKEVINVLERWEKGTNQFTNAMSAFRKLAKLNECSVIYKKLKRIDSTQTKFKEKQEIDLESFMEWRDKVLGITEELHPNCHINIREAWLWVFGMQIIHGLRISEVFAINNLIEPIKDEKGKILIHAYNDLKNNPHRIIYIADETLIGTTTKTGYRPVKPMESNKYPNLYYDWDLQTPKLPTNRPREGSKPKTIAGFYAKEARSCLIKWNAPFTQTHADRRLGNLLGIQAGLSDIVLAKNLGHTVATNSKHYQSGTLQSKIDVLTQSNKQAIDFTSGLLEAKRVIEKYPKSQVPIVELIAKIYQKSEIDIEALLS